MSGYDEMKKLLGLQEVRDNKQLKAYLKTFSIKGDIAIDPATTPWCAASMTATQRAAGNHVTLALPCLARSYLNYGTAVNEEDAQEGDILVFSRANGMGHVTYFVSWDDANNVVKVLGGNQSDQVCYENHSQDGLLGVRRP